MFRIEVAEMEMGMEMEMEVEVEMEIEMGKGRHAILTTLQHPQCQVEHDDLNSSGDGLGH